MRENKIKLLTTLMGLGLLWLPIFFSLGLKCNVEGNRPSNIPPVVDFANIPLDGSQFSSKPLIYWFGKDIDGYVAKYQYVVFKASQVQLLGFSADSLGVENSFLVFLKSIPPDNWIDILDQIGDSLSSLGEEEIKPVELVTDQGAGKTSDQVTLFASTDPNDIILQYLFLRAVDNASTQSEVVYRRFFRTNNPPNTSIDFNNLEVYYSLPDTTRTWKGITIAWGGKDSIDYPSGEAPLEFWGELFYLGPDPADTLTPDTTNLLAETFDPEDGDKWVTFKSALLPNGLQTGYHMFRVRARDDAFIPDSTPATSIFYVIHPAFEKDVLLVDLTTFDKTDYGTLTDPALYQSTYLDILASAGFPSDTVWYSGDQFIYPDERLVSHYKLVLIVNQDTKKGSLSDSLGRHLIKYLDVGGRIWLTGISNFSTAGTFLDNVRGVKNFLNEFNLAFVVHELGYPAELGMEYFGLEGYFMPVWKLKEDSVNCSQAMNCQPNYQNWEPFPIDRNEELIGATSLLPAPWPTTLELDTVKVKLASTIQPNRKILFKDKLPRVNYAVVSSVHPRFSDLPPAQAVYLANSAYGSSPLTIHGKPVLVRYQGPTFRTAVCTFPIFYLQFDDAVNLTRELINWLISPMPVTSYTTGPKQITNYRN